MSRILIVCLVSGLILNSGCGAFSDEETSTEERSASDVGPVKVSSTDWPWWRGSHWDGVASADQHPPLHWNASENVLWKSPIPGRGYGSVTVVGDQLFLATADDMRQTQSVLCYGRTTGRLLWKTDVHRGGLSTKGNKKATRASSTVACDGTRIFINFLNNHAVYTTALSRDGKQLWQTKITEYVIHQGYGSSPAVYRSLVLVSADNKGGGAIAALDRATGEIVWKHSRPKTPNYTSPIILRIADRDQLVFTGCNLVASFDPLSGKPLWEVPGATTECVTSTVTDGRLVITSGGYPKNHVSAMRGDGSGKIVWEKPMRLYVPSALVRDGFLYLVTDAGIALCWKIDTGKEMWKHRLGGTFSASPVLVGKQIFATNERGRTFVFGADPKAFRLVAKNDLGEEVLATPTFCGSRIFMRVAEQTQTGRQEMLYCLGVRK